MDKNSLLNNFDQDTDLIREVLEVLKSSSTELFAKMESAIAEKNAVEIAKYAHSLKGASSNFSQQIFTPTAARIEHLARSQQLDEIPVLFDRLKSEAEQLYRLVEDAIA